MRTRIASSSAGWLLAGAMALAAGFPQAAMGSEVPTQTGASSSKPAVAVMQFESAGATEVEASAATDRMQEELFALGKYTLVDRAQINEILQEQAFQQTGCTSTECAARVGRILGVRVLVTGKVTRLDETHWLISASMTDAETAETLRSTSIQYEGAYFDLLRDGMPILAAKVAGVTPSEKPGFVARIIDSVAGPNATMAGREKVVPKPGFAIFTGYNYQNGSLNLKTGRTLNYSGGGAPNLGLEYQWVLATPYTLSAYAEIGFGTLSGDLNPYYDTIDTSEFGLELRYWMTSRAFVGGRIASFNSEFYDNRDLSDAMNLAGTSIGASMGYEWDRGFFVKGALDFAVVSTSNVKIQANAQSPPVSVSGNGEAFSFWGDIGYRWK